MDLVVKKGELFRELQYVQGVVERKTTVPILANLLLETTGNALMITATDLDVTVQCSCPAAVKVSGALTVSARKLVEIVRLLPESDVHLKASGQDWINVTCERSRFKIASLAKSNFPDIPAVNGTPVVLSAPALRHMIARCIFAITQEESRYTLNGALMLGNGKGLSFVTTDGHRLVLITRSLEIPGLKGDLRILVPKKTLVELSKLTSEDLEQVQFGSSENHLFFRVGERLLVSRILSGQFPNYEMVIPKDNDRQVVMNTLDFSDALKRVATMADEQSHAVRFSFKEGQLDISSASPDYGEAKESIPVQYQGEPIEIGFNARYLIEFLSNLESEELILELKDGETQGLLHPKGEEGYVYDYVVMPMKL
ncbi:MAG: DNA polymerase III subunit beta [Acidobacteriota bacterium]